MDMTSLNTEPAEAQEVDITGVPITPAKPLLAPALLDRAEQAIVALLWVWLLWRASQSYLHTHNPVSLLVPAGELSVLIFILIRRPTQAITLNLGDWLLAITATAAPLFTAVVAQSPFPQLEAPAMLLFFTGVFVQVGAKLSLRRSFGIAPANRGVKVNGLYRVVRHPMYFGYLLMHMSYLALNPTAANAAIYAVGWGAQIRRLLAEEALLGQDPAYAAYMQRVRWHLLPGIF